MGRPELGGWLSEVEDLLAGSYYGYTSGPGVDVDAMRWTPPERDRGRTYQEVLLDLATQWQGRRRPHHHALLTGLWPEPSYAPMPVDYALPSWDLGARCWWHLPVLDESHYRISDLTQ